MASHQRYQWHLCWLIWSVTRKDRQIFKTVHHGNGRSFLGSRAWPLPKLYKSPMTGESLCGGQMQSPPWRSFFCVDDSALLTLWCPSLRKRLQPAVWSSKLVSYFSNDSALAGQAKSAKALETERPVRCRQQIKCNGIYFLSQLGSNPEDVLVYVFCCYSDKPCTCQFKRAVSNTACQAVKGWDGSQRIHHF